MQHDDVDIDRDALSVIAVQSGDSSEFAGLYARYYERIRRVCYHRLHDNGDADDATQEAFTKAWRAIGQFDGERRFYPWLYTIASNVCVERLRRNRMVPVAEFDHEEPGASSTEDQALVFADVSEVRRVMAGLSDTQRRVLTLRDQEGWTYREVAEEMGCSEGAVESLIWRARQAFKREFVST